MKPETIALIGTPYEEKDCWGIAVKFYEYEFNKELKQYYEKVPNDIAIANSLIFANVRDFIKVETPQYGDLIIIKFRGIESHIGVYIGEGKMLHSSHSTDCVVEDLERWKKFITGFYRMK